MANPYDYKTEARHVYTRRLHQPVQPALDFNPPQPANLELTLEARFKAFHQANPHILAELRRLAHGHVARGARRISVKLLFEELRTRCPATAGEDGYKLNNVFTPFYARILAAEPTLAGRIELRQRKAQ